MNNISSNNNLFIFRLLALAVIFILSGIYCIALGIVGISGAGKEGIDLTDPHVRWEDLESGDIIEMDLPYMGDCFMAYTRNGNDVSRRDLFPLLDFSDSIHGQINKYIVFSCKKADFDGYESVRANLKQNSQTGFHIIANSNTIHVKGKLRKITGEETSCLLDYLGSLGYAGTNAENVYLPLVVEPYNEAPGPDIAAGAILLVLGCGIMAIIIFRKK